MISFRWGIIACPTPTNSQVTVWKLRQPLFSHQIRIVLLTAMHSDALLVSLHFGLSLCNLLEQISPPYPIWKGTYIAFIWSIEAAIQQEVAEKWLLELFKLITPRILISHQIWEPCMLIGARWWHKNGVYNFLCAIVLMSARMYKHRQIVLS